MYFPLHRWVGSSIWRHLCLKPVHSASCKGWVLAVHIRHTKPTFNGDSSCSRCYCGSRDLPSSYEVKSGRVGSDPALSAASVPVLMLKLRNSQHLGKPRAGVVERYKPRVTLPWTSARNQSKKMSLVPQYSQSNRTLREDFMDHSSFFCSGCLTMAMENVLLKKKNSWSFCCQVGLLSPMGNVLKWQSCSAFWQRSFIKRYSGTFSIISVSQWRDKPC